MGKMVGGVGGFLDRQNEEPLWHGGGRECGTGKGATRGKRGRSYQVGYHIYS